MRKKEIKNLAKRIVACELVLRDSEDKQEIAKAQNEIMKITSQITSINDLLAIDAIVVELLEKNKKILDKRKIF